MCDYKPNQPYFVNKNKNLGTKKSQKLKSLILKAYSSLNFTLKKIRLEPFLGKIYGVIKRKNRRVR